MYETRASAVISLTAVVVVVVVVVVVSGDDGCVLEPKYRKEEKG